MDYDKGDVLGSGYFGTVFRGTFRGDHVAVKRVQIIHLDEREEEVMRKLSHPNVIRLLDSQEHGEFQLFALELCQGTLTDYCQEQYEGPKIEQVVGLQQMANGLAYIHSKKLAHRDIKPGNILFQLNEPSDSPFSFKISDFGLVKMTSEEGTFYQSGIKGTPQYMAPEKLDDEISFQKGTQAADVFALGCVFYYFWTNGHHPFGKRHSITVNIIKDKYDISGIENDVLSALFSKMIASSHSSRPKMREVVETLNVKLSNNTSNAESVPECGSLLKQGQPSIYGLRAREKVTSLGTKSYDIGEPNDSVQRKSILLLGATGSGKSTLVDTMINYVLGVRWGDPFRFKIALLEHNENLVTFTLHHNKAFVIPYSLTIIDALGYGNMFGEDPKITEQLRKFLSQQGNQINAICFVVKFNDKWLTAAQKDIISLATSLVGNSLNHIQLLTTFSDTSIPIIIEDCRHHGFPFEEDVNTNKPLNCYKFNNSVLFANNDLQNEMSLDYSFWNLSWNSLKSFFDKLATLPLLPHVPPTTSVSVAHSVPSMPPTDSANPGPLTRRCCIQCSCCIT